MLLAGSVLKLREEMKHYISFPDKAVFSGMALPEGSLTTQPEETTPKNAQPVYVDSPTEEIAMKAIEEEQTRKKQPPSWFPGWREVLHPSWLVIATGQIPPMSQGSRQRPHSRSSGQRIVQHQQADEELKAQNIKSEPTSPMRVLETAQWMTLPPGFLGVTACLWRSPLLEKACEVPPDPLQIAAVMEPTMATMSPSCIIKDEAMGWPIWTLWPLPWDEWPSVAPSRGPQLRGPS